MHRRVQILLLLLYSNGNLEWTHFVEWVLVETCFCTSLIHIGLLSYPPICLYVCFHFFDSLNIHHHSIAKGKGNINLWVILFCCNGKGRKREIIIFIHFYFLLNFLSHVPAQKKKNNKMFVYDLWKKKNFCIWMKV